MRFFFFFSSCPFRLPLPMLFSRLLLAMLPFRAFSGSESLGEPFPLEVLLVDELDLVEIQYIRVVRPVIPIFEHELVAEAH